MKWIYNECNAIFIQVLIRYKRIDSYNSFQTEIFIFTQKDLLVTY